MCKGRKMPRKLRRGLSGAFPPRCSAPKSTFRPPSPPDPSLHPAFVNSSKFPRSFSAPKPMPRSGATLRRAIRLSWIREIHVKNLKHPYSLCTLLEKRSAPSVRPVSATPELRVRSRSVNYSPRKLSPMPVGGGF